MYQPNYQKVDRTFEIAADVARRALSVVMRSIVFGAFLAACAIPFFLIEDKTKVSFWYCTGAFGVYLMGVSHMLNRNF